jgi:hypothetical protein
MASDWFAYGYIALQLLFGPATGRLMAYRARWFTQREWVDYLAQQGVEGNADPGEG